KAHVCRLVIAFFGKVIACNGVSSGGCSGLVCRLRQVRRPPPPMRRWIGMPQTEEVVEVSTAARSHSAAWSWPQTKSCCAARNGSRRAPNDEGSSRAAQHHRGERRDADAPD